MDLAIEIKNLNHSFGKKIICNNMNINFEYGKIYGLLGKNGTGKSTLINLIGNQLVCKSGSVKTICLVEPVVHWLCNKYIEGYQDFF